MRVIAGSARRLLLKTPDGLDTRPTTDRIKETLFNMLMPYLSGAIFVDLFSGSGGIGIEALSRGARKAYFVENSQKAIDCITDNLQHTHLNEQAVVVKQDVFAAIRGSIREDAVDVIFMDTLIVVEASLDTDLSYAEALGYTIEKEKIYKTNKHVFIVRS